MKQFSLNDRKAHTRGVECRRNNGMLDEAPGAYNNIEEVMTRQADLVEVVHPLKPIVCVKG
ncbi:MAG: RtcB family protein [Wenzhouxiangellaceae bacterium]